MSATRAFVVVAAFALGLQLPAGAGPLYKSIDGKGRVTFSDVPIEGAVTVQRIETSDSAKPAVGNESAPIYLALAEVSNEAVARANARLDMAEHAYALARQQHAGTYDPLSIANSAVTRVDRERLDFFKRDVLEARKTLLRALQQRSVWAPRPVA
jgi:hypothetical protein